jgi:hypothetical protein
MNVFAANPFGRKSLTGGEESRVMVPKGEKLRLRFGILLHGSPRDKPLDLPGAYQDFLNAAVA